MSVRILKATDIPMDLRRPHLARYRAQLRDALTNPSLTTDQKDQIRHKLANLGQIKPYATLAAARSTLHEAFNEEYKAARATSEPTPGAVTPNEAASPEAPPTSGEDLDSLLALTKDELITLAKKEGVEAPTSWTKAKIAEAILSNRSAA